SNRGSRNDLWGFDSHHVRTLSRQRGRGGELAAHDRNETSNTIFKMVVQVMAARDCSERLLGTIGQRTHSRVGIANVAAVNCRARKQGTHSSEQIRDLRRCGFDALGRLPLRSLGRADENLSCPGNYEHRTSVRSFSIKSLPRRTIEYSKNDVRTAD